MFVIVYLNDIIIYLINEKKIYRTCKMNIKLIFRKQTIYRFRKMRIIQYSNQFFKFYNFVKKRTNAIKKIEIIR